MITFVTSTLDQMLSLSSSQMWFLETLPW
jgi:hypothetical protein